ncbi:MAG: hypothetical protein ACREU3_04145 [Steroidobacteraceae bacterium]
MVQVWKIAPGESAEDWDLFREHSCIGLGWLVDSNYRNYRSEGEVLTALEDKSGKGAPGNGAGAAKMIWRFVHEVKPQDVVVANDRYNRVVGIGVVTSEYLPPKSRRNPIRKDVTTHRHHVRRVNWLITEPVDLFGKRFFVQSTLWPLETGKLNRIRQAYAAKYPHLNLTLEQVLVGYQAGISGLLPEEVAVTPTLFEGSVRKITVNAYERNPEARQRCIAAHGTSCCICGFSFGAVYGPEAEGYIHVHHVRALSEVGQKYIVDPIADLRPVCPNCHAVLHLGEECRSLEEVRRLLAKQKR